MIEKKDDYPLELPGAGRLSVQRTAVSRAHISMGRPRSASTTKLIRDFKGLSGGFDVTDWIMKGKKQDPYRYEEGEVPQIHAEEAR